MKTEIRYREESMGMGIGSYGCGLLRYVLRSLERRVAETDTVTIVIDEGQKLPAWLDTDNARLCIRTEEDAAATSENEEEVLFMNSNTFYGTNETGGNVHVWLNSMTPSDVIQSINDAKAFVLHASEDTDANRWPAKLMFVTAVLMALYPDASAFERENRHPLKFVTAVLMALYPDASAFERESRHPLKTFSLSHAVWTRPYIKSGNWDGLRNDAVCALLAVTLMERHGYGVTLHTDALGETLLGGAGYKKTVSDMDELRMKDHLFPAAKFKALHGVKRGLNMDTDIFIWDDTQVNVSRADYIFDTPEDTKIGVSMARYKKIKAEFEKNLSERESIPFDGKTVYNCGVVGGAKAKELCDVYAANEAKYLPSLKDYYGHRNPKKASLIIEQLMLTNHVSGGRVKFLNPGRGILRGAEMGYWHAMGQRKTKYMEYIEGALHALGKKEQLEEIGTAIETLRESHREPKDILYIVGNKSKCDHLELRCSLRSIAKWGRSVNRVYVVGYCPAWLSNEVTKLPVDDYYKGEGLTMAEKNANITAKLLWAIDHSDIGEEFLVSMDDHFYVRDTDFGAVPLYVRKGSRGVVLPTDDRATAWRSYLCDVSAWLRERDLPRLDFTLHRNRPVSRATVLECREELERAIREGEPSGGMLFLRNKEYGDEPCQLTEVEDVKIRSGKEWWKTSPGGTEVFSTYDFSENESLGVLLRAMYDTKSKYEK